MDGVIKNEDNDSYDYIALNVPRTMIRGLDVEVFSKDSLN